MTLGEFIVCSLVVFVLIIICYAICSAIKLSMFKKMAKIGSDELLKYQKQEQEKQEAVSKYEDYSIPRVIKKKKG